MWLDEKVVPNQPIIEKAINYIKGLKRAIRKLEE